MSLQRLYDNIKYKKIVFYRKNGKIKRVSRTVELEQPPLSKETPLFPISKERS